MRPAAFLALLALLVAAGCGGEDESSTLTAPDWAAPLLSEPGPEAAAVLAGSDFAVGTNRISFLLVRDDNSLVRAPAADVYYRPGSGGPPQRAVARPIRIVAAGAEEDATELYIAELRFPEAGKQWIVIQPRGVAFQAFQILDVKDEPAAVAVGERAPASRNPTLDTAPAERITTARPPDTALLRHSIVDSLTEGAPFVAVFATPAYCETRTCGPTVEIVDAVRKRHEARGVRFIHVEIYEDNLPGKGVNRWVREWRLPTEPWVFVVDREGVVRDRFEGAVSVGELDGSVRRHLLGG